MVIKDSSSCLFYYGFNKLFRYSVRILVQLINPVNVHLLENAINYVVKKHEWLTNTAIYHKGQHNYVKNNLPILVLKYVDYPIPLNSKKVNYHLLYLQYKGNNIYFNFSHIIGGGRSFNKIVFETLNEYVNLLNGKKTDFSNNEGQQCEMYEPEIKDFVNIKPIAKPIKANHGFIPYKESLPLFIGKRKNITALYEFKTSNLVKMARSFDSTPTALFAAIFFLVMSRVYPKQKKFSASIWHDPLMSFPKFSDCHEYFPAYVVHNFNLKDKKRSLQELSSIIHSSILWQIDSSMDATNIVNLLKFNKKISNYKFYLKKGIKMSISHPFLGALNNRFSFFLTYAGKQIHENLAPYVKNYFYLVDGHLFFEICSYNDKFSLSFQLSKDYKKYTETLETIFNEYGIEYNRLPNENRYLLPKHKHFYHLNTKSFLKKIS